MGTNSKAAGVFPYVAGSSSRNKQKSIKIKTLGVFPLVGKSVNQSGTVSTVKDKKD